MSAILAERPNGDTREFSFSEIQNGTLLDWATENDATADATAVLLNDGERGQTPSVPPGEQPKIVKGGSLVEDYSRAIADFDGSDDGYVYDIQSRQAVTVACRADPQGGSRQTLIEADGLLVYADGSGTIKARITNGTTTPIVSMPRHVGVMNVVAAADDSTLVLHIGGETSSTSHSVGRNQSGKVAVGKEVGGGNPLQGLLSDAFAWGRLFTASERRDVFENRLRRWGPLLQPYQESDLQDVERGNIHTNVQVISGIDPDASWGFDVPAVPIIPGNVQSNLDRPSAARRVNDNDLYESVASGIPRLQYAFGGGVEGLLVEADSRTNYVRQSSDVSTGWNVVGSIVGTQPSIIGNENNDRDAHIHEAYNTPDRVTQSSAGTFSSGLEVAWFIGELIEDQSQGSKVGLAVDSLASGDIITLAEYNFSNDNIDSNFDTVEANARTLQINGNPGVLLVVLYDPTVGTYGGDGRRIKLQPARDNVKTQVAWHHAQIEEAPNASTPIVTGSSEVTREADNVDLSIGDWHNPNQSTWIMTFTPRKFWFKNNPILGGTNNFRLLKEISFGSTTLDLTTVDNSGNRVDIGGFSPFSTVKYAAAFTQNEMRVSINGTTKTANHDGTFLSPGSAIRIGRGAALFSVSDLRNISEAPSKSALETYTS